MIIPFLNHTPGFATFTTDGVNSAQSVMDAIRTALLSAGWTEPGAAYTLRSPARSDIIRWTVTVGIGSSAAQITYVVKDHAGRLVNNDVLTRQSIPVATVCNLYYSDAYVFLEVNTQTSLWGAAVLHREPDIIAEPVPVYFATNGPRNNADTLSYTFFASSGTWIAAGGAGSYSNADWLSWRIGSNGAQEDHFSGQGSMLFYPVEQCQANAWFWGRLPNCLWIDSSQWYGNTFDVPLDETTVGTFRVARAGVIGNFVLAIRVS